MAVIRNLGKHWFHCLCCGVIFTIMSAQLVCAAALPSDLVINSDDLLVDNSKNTAIFTGKVVVWFDDMLLKTSKLEVFYVQRTHKRAIEKIIIPNNLVATKIEARHPSLPNSKTNDEVIIAGSAEYVPSSRALTLNNVKLLRQAIAANGEITEENILKTEKLIYYTKLQKILGEPKVDEAK